MITIQIPETYENERHYILKVLFNEFLGLNLQIQVCDRQNTLITCNDNRELIIADTLFITPPDKWLHPNSLPKQPLKTWDLDKTKINAKTVNPLIPVIFGDKPDNPSFFQQSEEKVYLGLDIFGSTFFMLTRYEEVVKSDRDNHNRFPAIASLAYQEGFLDRPIVNEYLEIFWACLQHLWPGLKRKYRYFQTFVSHDVDEPFRYAFTNISFLAKNCGSDILKCRNPKQVLNNISKWVQVKSGNLNSDPCNTFKMIMDISEKYNLKSAFYFITDHSAGVIDGIYNINHPVIRSLLHEIHERGHEIGLHTSYNTYKDPRQTKKEFEILKQVCYEEGIQQEYWGGRQHFLRWETPTTFQNWDNAGINYDSTLSFADVAGFRCGTCYEFSTFSIKDRRHLKLKERPLIIMDCTIVSANYMNLDITNGIALETIKKYKQVCQLFNGCFTVLWHNNRLIIDDELNLYKDLISS